MKIEEARAPVPHSWRRHWTVITDTGTDVSKNYTYFASTAGIAGMSTAPMELYITPETRLA